MEKNLKKCLIIGGMTIAFWIVSLCIGDIVNDRSKLSAQAHKEISQSWSQQQDIVGPILCVPVLKEGAIVPYICMYVLPEQMEVNADINSETLHRGIFDAPVYRSQLKVDGVFNLKDMKLIGDHETSNKSVRYDWANAQIITVIGDKRGIEDGIQVTIGEKKVVLNQLFFNYENANIHDIFRYNDAICKVVNLTDMIGKDVSFSMNIEFKGSDELNIAPIAMNSKITMTGNCSDPSFKGMMLPSTREVTKEGFSATWKVNSLNRNDVNQVFYKEGDSIQDFQNVGVKLMVVGGQYTKTDRALKYAFLVILLSLVAVFVGEMSVKSEIKALNYLLIGAALVLFYLMLLSFGEWMGFGWAYGLSALLIIGMITLYLKAIVRKSNTALAVCLFLMLIDIFIYILLGIEEIALLVGTLGLFIMLGIAMFFSLRMTIANKESIK